MVMADALNAVARGSLGRVLIRVREVDVGIIGMSIGDRHIC